VFVRPIRPEKIGARDGYTSPTTDPQSFGRRFIDRNHVNRTARFQKLDCAWTDVASPVALCLERRRDVPAAAVAVDVASDVAAVESGTDRRMCGRYLARCRVS
jgi:hypothetical protein